MTVFLERHFTAGWLLKLGQLTKTILSRSGIRDSKQ
jgi:hypothetical protein